MEVLVGFAGTVLGAALTLVANWFARRWEREDKRREVVVARAEELLGFCAEIAEWQLKCFRSALDGNAEIPPWSLFRWHALVSAYLPAVEGAARDLQSAIGEVQRASSTIAELARRQPKAPPPSEQIESVHQAMTALTGACAKLSEDIGRELKRLA